MPDNRVVQKIILIFQDVLIVGSIRINRRVLLFICIEKLEKKCPFLNSNAVIAADPWKRLFWDPVISLPALGAAVRT